MTPLSLQEYLSREIGYDAERMDGTPDPALARLITGISEACKEISAKVREGALAGVLGLAGSENVQGEDQKKLDIISNDIFVEAVSRTGSVCGMVSEEVPEPIAVRDDLPLGPYLACFDPLDGSSNIDINVSLARFSQFFRHVKSSVRLKRLIFCSRAQRLLLPATACTVRRRSSSSPSDAAS